ncbi:hypothetical protein JH06_4073 [Blastocystis sp. subtype 4]|uniref:hypothetical protein n=1 Tax=Blastocystis sp. subtype 4 TaxID=944170 RepID=UPI00071215C4|nr:hypothetical protein JH06_4073 [Blastocystis sp. subtype 4]KNB42353.1 hypothetical protein JH06_4073 [Blastocystis sp. subtype 4]|eukprot:XP_014525796.1 hypothetical protein JH06_4073 [Blastocystis sp. subtype 4]
MVGSSKQKKMAKKMRTGMKASASDIRTRVQSNPFEVRKNKTPHAEVIGRSVKGNNRNIIVSNEKALTQRQRAVGEDYEKINKKNIFKDRRFGAADTLNAVTEEEKMLKKLEIQRKKQLKKQRFALADDNEEDMLTHGGEALDGTITQAFNDLHEALDDEDLGELDTDLLMRTNLRKEGAQSGDRDKPKTQREIMMEIIEKSKSYRDERRRKTEALAQEIDAVDAMMEDVQSLLQYRKDEKVKPVEIKQSEADVEFDKLASQMMQEMKGKATDRQKTQEEIDQEELEKLEKLEKERENRMHGVLEPTQRETGDLQDNEVIKQRSDLDTAMDLIDEEKSLETEQNADEDEDYELLFGHKRQTPAEREPEKPSKMSRKAIRIAVKKEKEERAAMMEQAKKEIPYVIEIPRGVAELCELLNQYVEVDDSVNLLLTRIIKTNNPNVAKDKKNEFINFYRNVIALIEQYYQQNSISLYVLDSIQNCLISMQNYIPGNVASIWSDILTRVKTRVLGTKTFPRFSDILLLQMALNVYSITDYRHNIVNPAILLLARIALECRLQSNEEYLQSAYLVSILEDYSLQSKRVVPEMYSLLTRLCDFILRNDEEGRWKGTGNDPIQFSQICEEESNPVSIEQIQMLVLQLVEIAATLNVSNPAASVYLKELSPVVQNLRTGNKDIQAKAKSVRKSFTNILEESLNSRKHLDLQDEVLKPVFVSYAPAYEAEFTPGKALHPNKEHIRSRELRNQVKREQRGVEREIRREAEVISSVGGRKKI